MQLYRGVENVRPLPGDEEHRDLGFRPPTLRELWRALNATRGVDGAVVRYASLTLLVFYVLASFLRPAPGPAVIWVRAAVCVYIGVAVLLGPRFTWRALRLYTVGLVLSLNLATGAAVLMRAAVPGDLAVLALGMFAPTVFLQTAVDVLIVTGVVGVSVLVVVAVAVPANGSVAILVLFGALLTGGVTAMVLISFRDRISVSTAWWQDACTRERALREFAEGAAPQLGEGVVARGLAARLRHAFGTGHCAIIVADGSGPPRTLASAGLWSGPEPDAGALSELLASLADRQPSVRSVVADEVLPWARPGGTVVALPIVIDDAVSGAVVLSATSPRLVSEEELLLWRAMASQIGTALGSARMFARLQDALRARSEFVNTMSHELRSPLHVILGYGEMLLDGRGDPPVAAERIRANALELLQLVEGTLTVARLGGGRLAVQPSEFDLRPLFDELRESVTALPEASGTATVQWTIDGDMPPLRLDRLKLKEIIHNLVSNALKFAPGGTVGVHAAAADGRLRIDVQDSGPGISATDQERVFGLFERGNGTATDTSAGAGLGLYIVKSLTQLMGGEVGLTSAPGHGARFTVWLPIRIEDR